MRRLAQVYQWVILFACLSVLSLLTLGWVDEHHHVATLAIFGVLANFVQHNHEQLIDTAIFLTFLDLGVKGLQWLQRERQN